MNADVLHITGLTRRYGRVLANDEISLRVRPGEVVGLLGHNGAGKTTLVSQVVGLLKPDAGRVEVGRVDAVRHPAAARRRSEERRVGKESRLARAATPQSSVAAV